MCKHPPIRPSVFLGSSAEGLRIAKAIHQNLRHVSDVTMWSQGVFGLGEGTLEALVERLPTFDFAVLVLTPDDVLVSRGVDTPSPRDNVLLELGLFIGALGRKRSFIVYERGQQLKLPSDLAGVTLADFQTHADGNLQASLGDATYPIEEKIRELGPRVCGDFALCIPTSNADADEFSRELRFHLLTQLVGEGLKLLDYCPPIERTGEPHTLWHFREQIQNLADKENPRYLLAIWPGLCSDDDQGYVLTALRRLARRGCRIAFINEFPEIDASDRDFSGKVCRVHVDINRAIELLCQFIKRHINPSSHVLLIHACQDFQVAQQRKTLYEQALHRHQLTFKPREIPSWDAEHARTVVREELQLLKDNGTAAHYDVIAAANDNMAMGAVAALKDYCFENGVNINTKVIGYDGLSSAISMINSGETPFVATVAANPRAYAVAAFQLLCKSYIGGHDAELKIPIDRADLKANYDHQNRSHFVPPSG